MGRGKRGGTNQSLGDYRAYRFCGGMHKQPWRGPWEGMRRKERKKEKGEGGGREEEGEKNLSHNSSNLLVSQVRVVLVHSRVPTKGY